MSSLHSLSILKPKTAAAKTKLLEAGSVVLELEGQTVRLALDEVDRARLVPEL